VSSADQREDRKAEKPGHPAKAWKQMLGPQVDTVSWALVMRPGSITRDPSCRGEAKVTTTVVVCQVTAIGRALNQRAEFWSIQARSASQGNHFSSLALRACVLPLALAGGFKLTALCIGMWTTIAG
jgi:hypothetical protein